MPPLSNQKIGRIFRISLDGQDVTPDWWGYGPKSIAEFDTVVSVQALQAIFRLHEQMFGVPPATMEFPSSWVTDNYINQAIRGFVPLEEIKNVTFLWRNLPYATVGMLRIHVVDVLCHE